MKGDTTMYAFKIKDVISVLQDALNDGLEYVDITKLNDVDPDDPDAPPALNLEYIVDETENADEFVEAVVVPDNYSANY